MSVWKSKSTKKKKPWGIVESITTPFGMEGKIIYMNSGSRNSLKYYPQRNQAIYCLSGKVILEAPDEYEFGDIVIPGKGSIFEIVPGQVMFIQSGNTYRIKAVDNSVLFEVILGTQTNAPKKILEDDYGRA
tara:strand:+ start:775 stop:1167 length:393 start_codon:yes stop_codon:yes gene_type:complete